MENRKYWSGTKIDKLEPNEIFVFGSNPEARHFAGAARAALKHGAVPFNHKTGEKGIARGLSKQTYALVTKNLTPGVVENGITYEKEGFRSVSPEQIRANIDELYDCARQHSDKDFIITYQFETWPNGSPKKSLNGYDSKEFLQMFIRDDIPQNIVFHDSYKPFIEASLINSAKATVPSTTATNVENLIVISPREQAPEGFTVINTTSKDESIGKQFSPFYLSNIELYEGKIAKNMENAWQFSKVYKEFADENENPTKEYFKWAEKGWNDSFAHRYANGKGNIPLYSYWKTFNNKTQNWEEHKWDYVTSRKNIYFPLYAKAIINTQAFKDLKARLDSGEKIALWDFDGYKHADRNMSYEDVVNSEKYKCGHAFVLYGLLTGQLKLINDELIFDFDKKLQNEIKPIQEAPSEIAFTKVALPYGWLGNMAPYPVTYNSVTYKTTEALFQSLRFENHPEVQKEIIEQTSPMSAKMVAKKYKHLLEEEGYELMGEKDVENMRLCVNLKLEQHPELAQQLIDTGSALIIEDCTSRPRGSGIFWGAAKTTNGWNGENILGKIFMDKRQELQNNQTLASSVDNKEPTYTYFFQATSPFSQWHPALFVYKELQFICTEQFMMYAKAKTFKDENVASRIIHIEKNFDIRDKDGNFKSKEDEDCYNLILDFKEGKTDRTKIVSNYKTLNTWKRVQAVIKKLGREVANYDDEVWKQKRVPVVSVGNREKYNQNPDLKAILMATGDSIMVEASPYDKIWGIGLDEATAKKTPPEKWPGLNLLGLDVLTNLKTHYRNEPAPTTKMKM